MKNKIESIFSMNTPKCRFCYNYKPPGIIDSCCTVPVCATNAYISSLSSITTYVNNSAQTTQSSLLLAKQQQQQLCVQNALNVSTIQNTLNNIDAVTSTLYSQVLEVGQLRYGPYQPYIPPVVPLSVIELQMATANVGVGRTPITCLTGKGNQWVTT